MESGIDMGSTKSALSVENSYNFPLLGDIAAGKRQIQASVRNLSELMQEIKLDYSESSDTPVGENFNYAYQPVTTVNYTEDVNDVNPSCGVIEATEMVSDPLESFLNKLEGEERKVYEKKMKDLETYFSKEFGVLLEYQQSSLFATRFKIEIDENLVKGGDRANVRDENLNSPFLYEFVGFGKDRDSSFVDAITKAYHVFFEPEATDK